MLNIKAAFLLGAFLLVVSANPPNCQDCIGDSLAADIGIMNAQKQCWYNQHSNYLTRVKIANVAAIVSTLREALIVANSLTEEKCQAIVPSETCGTHEHQDDVFNCLVEIANTLIVANRDQELCHGKAFNTEEMSIASRFIRGTNAGWHGIHPDC